MELILLSVATILMIFISFFFYQKWSKSNELKSTILAEKAKLESDVQNLNSLLNQKNTEIQNSITEIRTLQEENKKLLAQKISLSEQKQNLELKLREFQEQSDKNTEILRNEFKVLASDILKSNTKEFSVSMLSPFQEKIAAFEKKMLDSFEKEMRDKLSLREEVKKLHELNSKISEEANNLTKALKGDQKQQGNWGEFILESILEKSGLIKDREYFTQQSFTDEEGKRLQPDLLVKLPDEKSLIIDSKVSLVAFERYVNSDEPQEKEQHLKDHLLSFKTHIKGLADKKYHLLNEIITPEFVLLFTPIESSFNLAISKDPDLFQYAWERNIVLVCPTTLLATLRTIASVWKQEKQTKNALTIAEETGKLYDQFVLFLESMEDIQKHLRKTQDSYDLAYKRLESGKGNVIKRIEDIKKLGIKSKKQIDSKHLDDE